MKYLVYWIASLFILHSCGHSQGHDSHNATIKEEKIEEIESETITNFPTTGFKVVFKDTISFSVEKVFPLFEPQGRILLYDNWNPTVLRKGKNNSLQGQVLFSKYNELDVMLTVTKYNPEKNHIQYLVVWDDFEIQRIDIYCSKGKTENSTVITWIEHNAGLYEKGVPLVSMFVEEGHLVKAVERYINNIIKRLDNEK